MILLLYPYYKLLLGVCRNFKYFLHETTAFENSCIEYHAKKGNFSRTINENTINLSVMKIFKGKLKSFTTRLQLKCNA